ncbi:hypothetical protein BpHYR1_003558 [Brachionus plicatilis]|uniref:Uncharacterized protein n=1 Tax=Brachionus plicatilis TaxID=10195 RepID=A0A3M7QDW2_BRAPC|nr:hypothetical protein BpHYR1_003558 [Brachionus plicatilis]
MGVQAVVLANFPVDFFHFKQRVRADLIEKLGLQIAHTFNLSIANFDLIAYVRMRAQQIGQSGTH